MRALAVLGAAVLLLVSLAGCSGGKDRDGDTMYDSQERSGWDITVDRLHERVKSHVTSDPAKADSDGDGLADNEEFFYGTDPRSPDTDGDGLTDCQEVKDTNRTHCEDPAYAGPLDGGTNTDPKDADSDAGASLYVLNGDFVDHTGTLADGRRGSGDGLDDGMELRGYTITLANGASRLVHTSPRADDTDGDGVDDGEEYFLYHTDPTVRDTDGDGCQDGLDPLPAVDEHYAPGLRDFTLRGPSSSVQLRLTLLVANVRIDVPAGSGSAITAHNGQATDLSGQEPAPVHSDQCSYSPRHPWVKVQMLAFDASTTPPRQLDIASGDGGDQTPGQGAGAWWNVQTGALAWSDGGGDAIAGADLSTAGADGTLVLHPHVVGP